MENYRKFLIECIEKVVSQHPEWGRMRIAREVYNTSKPMYKNKESKMVQYTERTIGDTYCQVTDQPENNKTSFEESENDAIFEYNGTQSITSLSDALKFCKVDQQVWEVDRHIFNSWDITMKDAKGAPIKRTNYQCKVWFKKRTFSKTEFQDSFLNEIKKIRPTVKGIIKTHTPNGIMLEVDMFDPHFGKLAHVTEGGENYDLKIAEKRYFDSLNTLLKRSCDGNKISKILFPVGNDWLHCDNMLNQTTAGTPQDVDGRWYKMWITGRRVLMESINTMSQIAPVHIVRVPSNHDFMSMFYMGDLLEVYYEKNKHVTIDNSPKTRKYFRWGSGGIGYTHGNEEKHSNLPLIMMRETQKVWSGVDFLEIHCGHFHKKKQISYLTTDEMNGITIRFMRSLSSTDAWHAKKGYTSGLKGCESFLWDYKQGNVGNFFVNIV